MQLIFFYCWCKTTKFYFVLNTRWVHLHLFLFQKFKTSCKYCELPSWALVEGKTWFLFWKVGSWWEVSTPLTLRPGILSYLAKKKCTWFGNWNSLLRFQLGSRKTHPQWLFEELVKSLNVEFKNFWLVIWAQTVPCCVLIWQWGNSF